MARFPYFAIESAISAGNSSFDKSSAVQPPLVPYFVSPATGVGLNLAVPARVSYHVYVLSYSTVLLCLWLVSCGLAAYIFICQSGYRGMSVTYDY